MYWLVLLRRWLDNDPCCLYTEHILQQQQKNKKKSLNKTFCFIKLRLWMNENDSDVCSTEVFVLVLLIVCDIHLSFCPLLKKRDSMKHIKAVKYKRDAGCHKTFSLQNIPLYYFFFPSCLQR